MNDLKRKSGLKQKQVEEFLTQQDVYTKHKPIKHHFTTRRVFVPRANDQLQADLVDMQAYISENTNYRYILTCIDCFSKYAWGIKIKTKTNQNINEAFKIIFQSIIPKKIQTDAGTEFIGKPTQDLFKQHNIEWFQTYNETKAQIVERFNRTLKTKMWKVFTYRQNHQWIDLLDDLLLNYNHSYHRSIKMKPIEAREKKNEYKVYFNLYGIRHSLETKPKFKVDDSVRITIKRKPFRKGYLPNFTEEIFKIDEVMMTDPITYKIKDKNDEKIIGSFYEAELVKV